MGQAEAALLGGLGQINQQHLTKIRSAASSAGKDVYYILMPVQHQHVAAHSGAAK
jgi:hypothetical protein